MAYTMAYPMFCLHPQNSGNIGLYNLEQNMSVKQIQSLENCNCQFGSGDIYESNKRKIKKIFLNSTILSRDKSCEFAATRLRSGSPAVHTRDLLSPIAALVER